MQVFKVYFKVIRKNLSIMLVYVIIFLSLAVMTTLFNKPAAVTEFSSTKCRIAVINDDAGAVFAQGMENYLAENAEIVSVKTDKQSLQDALFFGDVEYILHIPKGFSEDFLKGGHNILLEKTTKPDSTAAVQLDFLLTRYLGLASTYSAALPDITTTQLITNVKNDLKNTAEVTLSTQQKAVDNTDNTFYSYFIYLTYSMMAVMILGVTSIMMVFMNSDVRKRNMASTLPNLSFNLQLFLGNIVFSVAVWAILCGFVYVLHPAQIGNADMVMLFVNSLVYTLVCLSISFLIGSLIKSKNVQNIIANVFSLGLSFISGVFVPQELLGDTVTKISSFTPTYWYVKTILNLKAASDTLPIVYGILIQLGFAAAFLIITLVISKNKRATNA
ncbi:ABC transporter permease [Acetanaerobacterium elongatum]|uniref:ABC-2 type transport system permease protein n=1 Tax=Acetanaerobacterium elongatum TaxID=258515 RepID=A0A1G9ZV17_9FIRM|nr:ABC transporter permease [Acetanaerobacterium elongatum]SDN25004.1 ABC-2 type transport system permease protein [Acetanaerobacterium elongatum]